MLTLTVVEKYGPSNALENRVSSSVKVVVHDSRRESGELCSLFLREFSDSTLTQPSYVVRNFSTSMCPTGTAEELSDVTENRLTRTITRSQIGSPIVTLDFQGTCDWGKFGDACITATCEWWDYDNATKTPSHVSGTCLLTTVFEPNTDAWKLCFSNITGERVTGNVIRKIRF